MCLLLLQYLILIGGQGLRPWTPLGGLQRPPDPQMGLYPLSRDSWIRHCLPPPLLPNIAGYATDFHLSTISETLSSFVLSNKYTKFDCLT